MINANKVSQDVTGNVVTSGGDYNVESVRQIGNEYPVKETAEIKPETRESCTVKTLHVVTEASLAPTTENSMHNIND